MSLLEKNSTWKHDFIQVARESGFQFRQLHAGTTGAAFFDWKEIDTIDVDQIISDRDFHAVDRLLPHLMEAPIGTLIHNRILDPNIRKYLQLTQLAMQYLLFCKKFLDKTVSGLHSAINESSKDNSKLGRILKRKNQEIVALQNKIRDLEKNRQENFPCVECAKSFNSYKHVSDHMKRKHLETVDDNSQKKASSPPQTPNVAVTDKSLISTIKLELEVKQLKERLNAAEKHLQEQRVSTLHKNPMPQTNNEVRRVTTVDSGVQVNDLESLKKVGSNTEEIVSVNRLNEIMREQTKMIQNLRENERNSYKNELSELQSGFKEAFVALKSSIDTKLTEIQKIHENDTKKPEIINANVKKSDVVSKSLNDISQVEHINEIIRDEHEHWETRFKKLEKIFERNQELMTNNLKSLSQTYSSKFSTLEKTIRDASMKQQYEMTQSEPMLAKVVDRHVPLSVSPKASSTPKNRTPSPKPEIRQEKKVEQKLNNIKIVKPVQSDVKKGAIPKKPLTKSPVVTTNVNKYNKNQMKAPQKPLKEQTKVQAKVPEIRIENTAETQLDIFTAFCNRLKKYGIKQTNKSLSTPQTLAIKSQLGQERIKTKKRLSMFASIRSKLNANVDKEAKLRVTRLKDEGFTKETSSSDRFECTGTHKIDDILEESSSSCSSESEEIVTPFSKLPPLIETTESKSLVIKKQNDSFFNSNDSIFDISESVVTSTKLEDQLRRVLDSPIRRPSFPTQHMVKNTEAREVKATPVVQKRVNFSSQPQTSVYNDGKITNSPLSKTKISQLSLTNLSDESDFNFTRFK